MTSPFCLSICVFPLITFEPVSTFLRKSVGSHAIEGDLDAIPIYLET
jgi:hypothetical protein